LDAFVFLITLEIYMEKLWCCCFLSVFYWFSTRIRISLS